MQISPSVTALIRPESIQANFILEKPAYAPVFVAIHLHVRS
jgi:hypothetical protein